MLRHLLIRFVVAALLAPCAAGCLVLTLNPAYDDESIGWDARLAGKWEDADDQASLTIERGEWKSYKVHYVHPIETGDLTAYLTSIGDEQFLDVMPARGEDRGAFVLPVHAVLHVRLEDDRLELTPLSYDWFADRMRQHRRVPGLTVAFDQKENTIIASPTAALRAWLRAQALDGEMFGAGAVFLRARWKRGPGVT